MTCPAWLHNEIADGLTKLICLRLDNGPSNDMVQGTVGVWGVALTTNKVWQEERDRPRFRKGFDALIASGLKKWPQPAKLLEVLPESDYKRIEGSTNPDYNDPYERMWRERIAEYTEALFGQSN